MPDQAVITTASEVAEFLERHRACSKARPWAGAAQRLRKPGTDALCPIGSIWAQESRVRRKRRAATACLGLLVCAPGGSPDECACKSSRRWRRPSASWKGR